MRTVQIPFDGGHVRNVGQIAPICSVARWRRPMKRRDLLAMLAAGAIPEDFAGQARYTREIALPRPKVAGALSLEEVIARRRSVRTFTPRPLPIGTIGQLLWAGQGITSPNGKRTAPSAGALYGLELYAVTKAQLMHYLPHGHRVEMRDTPDLRPQLGALAQGQTFIEAAPLVIVVAANPDRLSQRYGARAKAYTDIEVGHAAQNMLLQAVALRLAAVPVGAVDTTLAARRFALPPGQAVVYLLPVGFAA